MPKTIEHDLRELDSQGVARRLRDASDDTIANALHQLPPEQAHKVLERFDATRREAIERADVGHDLLLGYDYPEGTVGRLIESAPAVFPLDATIGEVVEALLDRASSSATTGYTDTTRTGFLA